MHLPVGSRRFSAGGDQGPDAVFDFQEGAGKLSLEEFFEFAVEAVACPGVEGGDAGRGTDASAPTLGRIGAGDVEAEGLELAEARLLHITRPPGVHAVAPVE